MSLGQDGMCAMSYLVIRTGPPVARLHDIKIIIYISCSVHVLDEGKIPTRTVRVTCTVSTAPLSSFTEPFANNNTY